MDIHVIIEKLKKSIESDQEEIKDLQQQAQDKAALLSALERGDMATAKRNWYYEIFDDKPVP